MLANELLKLNKPNKIEKILLSSECHFIFVNLITSGWRAQILKYPKTSFC